MLGMGATLALRDFLQVFRNPAGLAIGLFAQLVLVPAWAVVFITVFNLTPGWAVGLLLVSVVPGGAFSNLLTYFGKGNVPLSISLTTVSTLGCIVTVPLILGITASSYLPGGFEFPAARIIRDIFAFLLVPLAVGMVVFRVHQTFASHVSKWSIRASLVLIILITISALRSGRIKIPEYGWKPPLLILAFGISLGILMPQVCRLLRRYDDDTIAITIEVVLRNIGVALLLILFFFPGKPEAGHVLYTCLFYAGMGGALAVPPMLRHRRGKSPVLFRPPYRRPEPQLAAGTATTGADKP